MSQQQNSPASYQVFWIQMARRGCCGSVFETIKAYPPAATCTSLKFSVCDVGAFIVSFAFTFLLPQNTSSCFIQRAILKKDRYLPNHCALDNQIIKYINTMGQFFQILVCVYVQWKIRTVIVWIHVHETTTLETAGFIWIIVQYGW